MGLKHVTTAAHKPVILTGTGQETTNLDIPLTPSHGQDIVVRGNGIDILRGRWLLIHSRPDRQPIFRISGVSVQTPIIDPTPGWMFLRDQTPAGEPVTVIAIPL